VANFINIVISFVIKSIKNIETTSSVRIAKCYFYVKRGALPLSCDKPNCYFLF